MVCREPNTLLLVSVREVTESIALGPRFDGFEKEEEKIQVVSK